jgi:hypothetical protein
VSRDPISQQTDDALQLDPYSYANANPVRYVDANGTDSDIPPDERDRTEEEEKTYTSGDYYAWVCAQMQAKATRELEAIVQRVRQKINKQMERAFTERMELQHIAVNSHDIVDTISLTTSLTLYARDQSRHR